MPDIKVLDSHIADLIAAGEVVERPASVAKELMENAIDAGASKVTVEIAHGGLTFLRVTDDGRGIPNHQLKTAFLRHATSKLRTEYDLEAIGTLGFRGEALAAIAAVSRVQVMSRTPEAELGATLSGEGGVFGAVEEAGCPLGTTMVVRDLFFNTPARLKFMKKDAAEGAAVFATVQRVALSHPEVSVKFLRDGKLELLTPGDGQLKSAVYAVLGRELALGMREVNATGEEMTVTGFTSLPACCRGSRNYQFFFVNGRQVKSRIMMAALEEAYKNQKMVGKFPGCVLHLETKFNAVDVNVHPAKTEVKFGNERQVFSAVYHAVLSALEGDRTHPAMTVSTPERPRNAVHALDTVTPNQQRIRLELERLEEKKKMEKPVIQPNVTRLGVNDFTKKEARPVPTPPAAPVLPGKEPVAAPATVWPEAPKTRPAPAAERPGEEKTAPLAERPAPPVAEAKEEKPLPVEQSAPVAQEEIPWRMAGEVLNTYIIVEQGEKIFFIDKHAAHERMNFDRLKAQDYRAMTQTLLTPLVCRLDQRSKEVLLANAELLEDFGFDAEELGSALVVRQAPFDVELGQIEETLEEIAGKLLNGQKADPAAARDEVLHTMACKAAIKGGWHTSPQELEKVAQAVMSGRVKYCPHGRPVAIELTKKELEKQFKRV